MKINRIHHHYTKWEDYINGMYGTSSKNDNKASVCIDILGNEDNCRTAMMRVINEWKYTCEDNLTNTGLNRKSWLGQSACNIMCGATEDLTRLIWFQLSEEQRNNANKIAQEVIEYWENNIYLKN